MHPPPAPAHPQRQLVVYRLCRATGFVAIVMGAIWLISLIVTQSDETLSEYSSGGEAVLTVFVLAAYVALGATLAVQADGIARDVGGAEARRSWGLAIALFALFCADALLSCLGALGLSELANEAEYYYGRDSSVHSALAAAAGWAVFLTFLVIGAAVLGLVTMIQFNGLRKATGVAPVGTLPAPGGAVPAPVQVPVPTPNPTAAPAPAPDPVSVPPAAPPAPAPVPETAPPAPNETTMDIAGAITQLKELSELLDKGHITREEYDRIKGAIPGIGGPGPTETAEPAEPPTPDPAEPSAAAPEGVRAAEPEPESGSDAQAATPPPQARRGLLDDLVDDD